MRLGRMRRIAPLALASLAFVFAGVPALAQTQLDINNANQQAQRLIQEQQQREQQRIQELERRQRRPSGEDLTTQPAPPADAAAPGRCFDIRQVVLDGATLLSAEDREKLTRPLIGRCVGLPEINDLIQAITNHYITRGYATTRAYIPEQDMTTGTLHLLVLEGLVEKIMLDGSGLSIGTAFPRQVGQIFNLREFEQGLDQINRLRSNNATMDIAPGDAPGASVIKIDNTPAKRWILNLANDNTGSQATGWFQTSATLGVDDLAGLNDYLNLSFRENPNPLPDQRLSRSLSALYTVPYGRWLFSLSASDFKFVSLTQGQVAQFQSSGTARTSNLHFDRMMYRDQSTKLTLSGGLTFKDNINYLNGATINNSSRKLNVADVGANLSLNALGALWSFDLGRQQGLSAYGALRDPGGLAVAAPRAQFTKYTYGANVSLPMKFGAQAVTYQTTLTGQYSPDVLYGTEQLTIGGPFSVRGYRTAFISGDSGLYARNELGVPFALSKVLGASAPKGEIKPFVAYDVGHISDKYGVPGGSLSSVTVGFALAISTVSLQFSQSVPEHRPSRLTGIGPYTYVRIAIDI